MIGLGSDNKIFNFVTQCSLGWMWLCCWLFWLPFPCVLLAVFQFSHNFQNSILILWFRADFLFKLSNSELEDQCGCAAGAVLAPTAGTLCFLLHWGALLLQSQRSFISLNTKQNKPFSFELQKLEIILLLSFTPEHLNVNMVREAPLSANLHICMQL